jgi:hypothetical protein
MFDDSDSPDESGSPAPAEPESLVPPEPESPASTEEAPEPSPAQVRFKACRWHAKEDDDGQEYCSNRDVLPYAGKHGFAPEAWCPDCALYKLRRTPKKRPRVEDDDYGY